MEFNIRRLLIWFLILLLFLPLLSQVFTGMGKKNQISMTQMYEDISQSEVERLVDTGSQIEVAYVNSDEVKYVTKSPQTDIVTLLEYGGIEPDSVQVEYREPPMSGLLFEVLINGLPILLMVLFFVFIIRQARGAQDGIMGFGRSKAKLFAKGKQNVTFKDVGGVQEAKLELEEVVDFLKNPKKYRKLGARTPKGVLLVGPSGTGKTLLARAVAGEAGVPFFSMAGSEFMEMLVGVGASRVRDLFDTAKKNSPCIIFIDEIDAIGRMRGLGTAGGHDEREQTLNQILVEMDGFTPNDNVIVLAATNRGDLLDPALTRPGRFDRRVTVMLPDLEERKRILAIHAVGKPFDQEVNWERVAKRTVGYSGADIENMLNEAAILAARNNRDSINAHDVEEAAMKVKLGPERKRLQDDYERKMTAYHEAGHAIVAHFLPHTDRVHRVSIVSRGMALGYTLTPPEKDKYQQTKSELLEDIAVLLGGRSAEKIVFNELTGGAASDIDRATRVARAMVVDYGMSDLGPVNLGPQFDTAEWGRLYIEPTKLSEKKQAQVDEEIGKIIAKAGQLAEVVIKRERLALDRVVDKLLEQESIDTDEFEAIIGRPKAKPKIMN
ncbi:cell division protein FtsH [Microgenomates group bacterium RBG_16_45_19]|nr:MAG: cell division protein FtsH [Microgenomates group bacterium RBG_16_45_19]